MINKSTIILASSAIVLFLGLASFVYAISVGNDFDFGGVYRIQNASTTTILGGLSVGTTTPQSAGTLYVGTTLKFGDGTSQTTAGASSVSAGQVSSGIFGSIAGKGNYTFQAAANSNTVLFVDASNERVGIGTASPAARFHVSDAYSAPTGGLDTNIDAMISNTGAWTGFQLLASNANGAFIDFGDTDDANVGQILYSHASNYLSITTNAAERLRITSTGNVGIGTSTPATKLHLFDGASGPIIQLSGLTTNYRGLTVKDASGTEQWFYGPNSSNNFVVRRSGSTDNVTVNATTGNVGIATTTPGTALVINGTTTIAMGSLVFPDTTKQTTAAVSSKPPLRFTRDTVSYASSEATMNALCSSEFGTGYTTASRWEAALYSRGVGFGLAGDGSQRAFALYDFSSDGLKWAYADSGYAYYFPTLLSGSGSATAAIVACVFKTAPIRFTHTGVNYTSGLAAFDAQCSSEFGSTYRTATPFDVAVNAGGAKYGSAGGAQSFITTLTPSYGTYGLVATNDFVSLQVGAGSGSHAVACVSTN